MGTSIVQYLCTSTVSRTHKFISFQTILLTANSLPLFLSSPRTDPDCQFELEYFTEQDKRHQVSIKSSNGKYVMAKPSGHLFAKEDGPDSSVFCFELINRPILVLKNDHGFVATTKKGDKYECARATYEVFKVSYDRESFAYHFSSKFNV